MGQPYTYDPLSPFALTDGLLGQRPSGSVFFILLSTLLDLAHNEINKTSPDEVTIDTGDLSVTQSFIKVQPESGTEDSILSVSDMSEGQTVVAVLSDPGTDVIEIVHSSTLSCPGGQDIIWSHGIIIFEKVGSIIYVNGGARRIASQFWLSGAGLAPASTNGCGYPEAIEMSTNKNIYRAAPFDKDSIEYGHWEHALPYDYDGGVVKATFYWFHTSASANYKASWSLQAVATGNDGALDAAYGTKQTVNDEGGTNNDIYISSQSSDITIAGSPSANNIVNWRVFREATDATNDTLDSDAYLLGIMIDYTRR